ncbi:fasciclin-2-like [Uloborus diversus]|uniref:fasciclin-2-like n=1 Tax=Uloborus diversus TaxID=327109 RepID=UPI00240A0D60|nr:fasciclin-2-like [Uloborus diversus]
MLKPHRTVPLGLELVVEEVRYKDQGTYTCSAVVDGRETRTFFTLKVYLSITFWGTADVQTGRESSDHMVLCSVRSDPPPIISWYVNGSLILDGPRRTITEDGLYIRNLKPSDAGNYTCRAFVVTPYNSQIKDKNIAVNVHYKPVWSNPDVDTFYGVVGSVANLSCEASAEPLPTFEWFRGRALLVLPNTPSFTLSSEEPGILVVKIYQSPYDSLPVVGFKIRWKQKTDSWRHAREYLTSQGHEFVIQDLNFDTDYEVRVSAKNAIGFSNFTEPSLQRTKGLVAETVVDGSSILSSTFNQSPNMFPVFHNIALILSSNLFFYHMRYKAS